MCEQLLLHLGVLLDQCGKDEISVKNRIRKCFGAVNAVATRLVSSAVVWNNIMELQLFPILKDSHLWNVSRSSMANLINQAYKRGIRSSLGMKGRDCISLRLGDLFT